MLLKDKVAIITGAGKGIGRETAIDFAKEGANIVLVSMSGSHFILYLLKLKGYSYQKRYKSLFYLGNFYKLS